MNNLILGLLPIILLIIFSIVLYIFIFTRKGGIQKMKASYKGQDQLTFIGTILAALVLASALIALGLNIPPLWSTTILVLFFAFVLIVIVHKVRTGKPIFQQMSDERVNMIYAKSARNALFATYLAFFVHLLITDADALDTLWLVITLAGGLLVLIASTFFYYYRKS